MGNSSSHPELNIYDFYTAIDYIAAYYILSTDYENLSRLSEKEYCDKLTNLTSTIISKSSTKNELFYLHQRIQKGWSSKPTTPEQLHLTQREKKTISQLLSQNQCNQIAKFYVKIAHIFAAILTTINPVYMYKNSSGQIIRRTQADDTLGRKIGNTNICDSRISKLKQREAYLNHEKVYSESPINTFKHQEEKQEVEEKQEKSHIGGSEFRPPTFCEVNNKKSLNDEPGIHELKQLYFDEYDYETGEFSKMSSQSKEAFKNDLKLFYTEFTGEKDVPPTIDSFSDIKLKSFNKSAACGNRHLSASTSNILKYSASIRDMIKTATAKQLELLKIIDILFIFVPETKETEMGTDKNTNKIRINPLLTETVLEDAVVKTRKLIMELYLGCERDYTNSLKLFESILEQKIFDTTMNQINNMELQAKHLINENMPGQTPAIRNSNSISNQTATPEQSTTLIQEPLIKRF
jgi:hypothetical protein